MSHTIDYIPDFFVIGAMKAGTSTLFRDFFVNPDIERTKGKEVNFMLSDLSREDLVAKYKQQYSGSELLKCDVSPKYSQFHNHPAVAERIFRANPRAKIIYITRDPIERIISHLHHDLLRHRLSEDRVNEVALNDENYVMCSRYQLQINEYLRYFPKDQVLVLMLEEVKSDTQQFCSRLNSFLGLESIRFQGKRFNVSENRYKIVGYDPVHKLVKNKWLIRMYHGLWYFINIKVPKPELSPATTQILKQKLSDQTNSFANAFGLDLKLWQNFNE